MRKLGRAGMELYNNIMCMLIPRQCNCRIILYSGYWLTVCTSNLALIIDTSADNGFCPAKWSMALRHQVSHLDNMDKISCLAVNDCCNDACLWGTNEIVHEYWYWNNYYKC